MRQHGRDQRRQQEDALVGARRDDRLLEDEFQKVGERLQQPPRTDDVRAAAQLHRRPDLAVGIEDVGDEDQQHDDQHDRLQEHDQRRAARRRRRRSPWPCALLGCLLEAALRQGRAFGHDGGGPRDRVGQIEILDRRREDALVQPAAESRDRGQAGRRRPPRCRRGGRDADARRRASGEAAPANRRAASCRARPTAPGGSPSPRAPRPARSRRGWSAARGPSVLT